MGDTGSLYLGTYLVINCLTMNTKLPCAASGKFLKFIQNEIEFEELN